MNYFHKYSKFTCSLLTVRTACFVNRHDIPEILLNVALKYNRINQTCLCVVVNAHLEYGMFWIRAKVESNQQI